MSQIGETISHYRVEEELGRGGMGEVYLATDTKLKRKVAIKVLSASLSGDEQHLARLTREAEVLASLDHSGIGQIYGIEEVDGGKALVLQLIEGPTLADRIKQGQMTVEEALPVALEIAEALEAAHEKGIIHRDLKPANIKITPEGKVKLLDFGLAKAVVAEKSAEDISNSPTLTMQASEAGMILGTAAYMSPEQAKGKPIDTRADTWAFGVVLFEMLTAQRIYEAEDVSETMAAVLRDEPEWELLPKETPQSVHRLLRRCLSRNPKRRLRDIGEARIVLEDYLANPKAETPAPASTKTTPMWRIAALWITVAGALVLGGLGAWVFKPVPDRPLMKTAITADRLREFPDPPTISPNGKIVVYSIAGNLWIRYLDRFEATPLPDSKNTVFPFFSPDSRFLGYRQGEKLWKVELASGAKSPICDLASYNGATWGSDDFIVFGVGAPLNSGFGLYRVSAQGGDPQLILEPDPQKGERGLVFPHYLPDQRAILFHTETDGSAGSSIALLVDDQRTTLLAQENTDFLNPVYSPSGHLIYRRNGNNPGLFAVPFSLSSLEISGQPFLIDAKGHGPAVSKDGTLIYTMSTLNRGADGQLFELVRLDRTGRVTATVGQPQENIFHPELSSDGNRVAVSSGTVRSRAIWLHDIERGNVRRLSFSETRDTMPAWNTARNEVAFQTELEGRNEIWVRPADSSSDARKLTDGEEPHFSRDGHFLVFSRRSEETGRDVWYLELGQEAEPKRFLATEHDEFRPRLSPDRQWIAYTSSESGRAEIYVKGFPSGQGLWQISNNGGDGARWSPDGTELFYLQGRDLMAVSVKDAASFDHGAPQKLFPIIEFAVREFAVADTGKSFLVPRIALSDDSSPSVAIVQNWFLEFRDGASP